MIRRMVVAACAARLPYKPYALDYHSSIYRLERIANDEERFWLFAAGMNSKPGSLCWQDGGKI